MSAVLADFRAWLTALTSPPPPPSPAREEGEDIAPSPLVGEGGGGGRDTIDLHTLLGQFLAVRQEVNLQTRAVRAQQEQNSETLRQLTAALDALRQSQELSDQTRQQDIDESLRPLLKTLIDLYDALALAGREMQRLRQTVPATPQLPNSATEVPRSLCRSLSRFFNRKGDQEREQERERVRQLLASLVTGYTMSLQRIDRALRQHGLEAVPATGERFDPERMEVVEAVADSGRPSGEVIEEVRRGYLYNGRVFRYAQVRVAKG